MVMTIACVGGRIELASKVRHFQCQLGPARNLMTSFVSYLKAHLHDAIFAYDCCMQLAAV